MERPEGRYDFRTAEPRLQASRAEAGIYEFDPRHDGPPYTVDTPPPTVSGRIQVGHVYSYTHADIMIRYHRMKGEQVLYPFGFDDTGRPTERFAERARHPDRDFYTIVRSLSLRDEIPWTDVMIRGHALDPSGKEACHGLKAVVGDLGVDPPIAGSATGRRPAGAAHRRR